MPAMGESILECTVLNWLVEEGASVEQDDMILEVATDKIDTEIGAAKSGTILKFLVQPGQVVAIGNPICEMEIEEEGNEVMLDEIIPPSVQDAVLEPLNRNSSNESLSFSSDKFYSPLVQSIAKEENISREELESIQGTGLENRVTKNDVLNYLKQRSSPKEKSFHNGEDVLIEMDRMRSVISERMVASKRISAHVTSFIESDLTAVSKWRSVQKGIVQQKHGLKLTFTPILVEAVVRAIEKYPRINIQVDGNNIIQKGGIHIGLAVALANGNLIVPVIHHANTLSLKELAEKCNDLAVRARNNQLKPEELVGGTYTISNIGTFGNIAGTPIILQPQVAIMAFGAIRKKPAVLETEQGDVIAIREQMIISHSYDHRVVDGSLGGMFLKEVSDYLENFDTTRSL